MIKQNRVTTFRIFGGLGNQLFIYVAGCYFANKTNKKVKFSLNKPDFYGTKHESDLRNLGIVANFDVNTFKKLFHFLNYFLDKKFKFDLYRNSYKSKVIGFDDLLFEQNRANWIEGYFQTYKYVTELEINENLINFDLFKSNKEFATLLEIIQKENCIAVHVRRGDYKQFKNYLGVLSEEYFNNALRQVRNTFSNLHFSKVFIFTDELDNDSLLDKFKFKGSETIFTTSYRFSDEETLALMSAFQWIVLSNSSFSWWAAMLGNQKKHVVAPSKWYVGKEDPQELIPSHWNRCESVWIK